MGLRIAQAFTNIADTFKGGNVACQSSSTSTTIGLSIPPSSPIVEAQKGLEAALIQSALYSKRLYLPMPTNALYHTSAVQPLFSVAFISMVQHYLGFSGSRGEKLGAFGFQKLLKIGYV